MKPTKLTIAVIIPTYNEAAYIERCLKAVTKQTRQPDELIVVDNNSTDQTVALTRKFKAAHLLHESRQGQVFGRKTGFDSTKADILVTIDADSEPHPDWLAKLEQAFVNNPDWSALTGYVGFYDGRLRWLAAAAFNLLVFEGNRLLAGQHIMYGSNMAVRRASWLKVRTKLHLDPDLWEDFELAFLVNQAGGRVGLLRQASLKVSARGADRSIPFLWNYLKGWGRTYQLYRPPYVVIVAQLLALACFIQAAVLHLIIKLSRARIATHL